MFTVEDNKITLTRGDTFEATLGLKVKGSSEPYVPVEGDKVRFIVKNWALNSNGSAYVDKTVRIEKAIPIATMQLKLEPNDTKPLPFGRYAYDIEVTLASGKVDTVIEREDFIITPEVD
jgi:hypothetical protein